MAAHSSKCKICHNKLNKNWNYCPKCGTKKNEEGDLVDFKKVKIERIRYLWERQHGGKILYENFESLKGAGYIFPEKTIRKELGDFSDINLCDLRLFSFLYFKPDYVNELMKVYKSYGYYSAYLTAQDMKLGGYVGSDVDDEKVWREIFSKRFSQYFSTVLENTRTGILKSYSVDYKNRRVIMELSETSSSLLKSKKPICFLELASVCGPLEAMSNVYWSGEEAKCLSADDEVCQLIVYPSKTEDFENIPKFTKEEFNDLIDQNIEDIFEKKQKRKHLGNMLHIFDNQLLNYYLISLSPGHALLSQYSGTIIGGRIIKRIGTSRVEDTLDKIVELFTSMKVGLIEISSKSEGRITLTMRESAYSSGVKNINMKLDIFIAGIIEGALKEATKQKWSVEETRCIAKGDKTCEFNCEIR
ncbi:MAG: V4R domain-containing protein [Candidatus Altiarchaeota archaeon]